MGFVVSGSPATVTSALFPTAVFLAGQQCSITSISTTEIRCTTSAYKPMLTRGDVVVRVSGLGVAVPAAANNGSIWYQYVDRWSALTTWGGDPPPIVGDSVVIPPGITVLLDTSPPALYALIIQGSLIFDDSSDLNLTCQYIIVNGGLFQVGTEADPFIHRAVITLTGHMKIPQLPLLGGKSLGVHHGVLDLHGDNSVTRTWTHLSASAYPGNLTIVLEDAVAWPIGATIIVATSSNRPYETEQMTIANRSADGRTLTLTSPLQFLHESNTFYYNMNVDGSQTVSVDIKSEVGLLTQNVVVRGDDASDNEDLHGGMIRIATATGYPVTARISNIEMYLVGQGLEYGFTPIGMDMVGDASSSYFKHVTIHRSFNRGFSLHGVMGLTIEDCVVYRAQGHGVYTEDAVETGNVIKDVLVANTEMSLTLLNTELTPSAFMLTNPANIITGCAAVASQTDGFSFFPAVSVIGASADAGWGTNICPKNTPFTDFTYNTAHSNSERGLFIFDVYTPKINPCSSTSGGLPVVFDKFMAYRNGWNGIEYTAGSYVSFRDVILADNANANLQHVTSAPQGQAVTPWAGLIGPWWANSFNNSLVIGHTPTFGSLVSNNTFQSIGLIGPSDHGLLVDGITFASYDWPRIVALRACSRCEDFCYLDGGWETRFRNISWTRAPNRVMWRWAHEGVFTDLDGTLSNTSTDASILKPVSLLPDYPLLQLYNTCYNASAYSIGTFPGRICPNVTFHRFGVNNIQPYNWFNYRTMMLQQGNITAPVPFLLNRRIDPSGWGALVPAGTETGIYWDQPYASRTDPNYFEFTWGEVRAGQDNMWSTNFVQLPGMLAITSPIGTMDDPSDGDKPWGWNNTWGNWTLVNTTSQGFWITRPWWNATLGAVPPESLTARGFSPLVTRNYESATVKTIWRTYPCPKQGCWSPPPPDCCGGGSDVCKSNPSLCDPGNMNFTFKDGDMNFTMPPPCELENLLLQLRDPTPRLWSDPNTWALMGIDPPQAGDHVVIDYPYTVMLDQSTPPLGSLWIGGVLIFKDFGVNQPKPLVLTTDRMIVRNRGKLQIGTRSAPYQGQARIMLNGDQRSVPFQWGHAIIQPKTMVVIGEIEMVGSRNPVNSAMWTSLALNSTIGAKYMVVKGNTGWKVNDTIVITTTTYTTDDTETAVLTADAVYFSANDSSLLRLTSPLLAAHTANTSSYGAKWSSVTTTAQVGLLTRNIVVEGVDPAQRNTTWSVSYNATDVYAFGARTIIMKDSTDDCTPWAGGSYISGVQFSHSGVVGQLYSNGSGAALRYLNLGYVNWTAPGDQSHYVQYCSFTDLYHSGIAVHQSGGIMIDNNVIHESVGSSIRIEGTSITSACNVTRNLVAGMISPAYFHNFVPAIVDIHAGVDVRQGWHIVQNNVVAGSDLVGYYLVAEPCAMTTFSGPKTSQVLTTSPFASSWRPLYSNNEAHGVSVGLWLIDNTTVTCTAVTDWKIWRAWDFGLFGYLTASTALRRTAILDSKIGLHVNIYAPSIIPHLWADKSMQVRDSLFVGSTFNDSCAPSSWNVNLTVPRAWKWAFGRFDNPNDPGRVAILLSSFTSENRMNLDAQPQSYVDGYPALHGVTILDNVTFAKFTPDSCGHNNTILRSNPFSSDVMHPVHISNATLIQCAQESLIYINPPRTDQLNLMGCVNQACDGQKEVLINDLDNTFFGSPSLITDMPYVGPSAWRTSVFSRAELAIPGETGNTVPRGMLLRYNGTIIREADLSIGRGISRVPFPMTHRLTSSNITSTVSCSIVPSWNAWKCHSPLRYRMLVIESMDYDSENRRLVPVGVLSRGLYDLTDPDLRMEGLGSGGNNDTMGGGFLNILAGPKEYGMCYGYACRRRISTFYTLVSAPQYYTVYFATTNPQYLRLHLLNADFADGVVLSVWYSRPQKLAVYVNGQYFEDLNWYNGAHRSTLPGGLTYVDQYPTPDSITGTNAYIRLTHTIHLTVRGPSVVEIKTLPVVQVSLTLAVSVETFFLDQVNFVASVAFVLNIPPSRIRVASIVPGSTAIDMEVLPDPALVPSIYNSTTNGTTNANSTTASSNSSSSDDGTLNTPAVHDSLLNVQNTLLQVALNGSLQAALASYPIENMGIVPPPTPIAVVVASPATGSGGNATANDTSSSADVSSPAPIVLGKGVFTFLSSVFYGSETSGSVNVKVSRVNGTFTTVGVSYIVEALGLSSADDAVSPYPEAVVNTQFTPISGSLTFGVGVQEQTVAVPVFADSYFHYPPARFRVRLTNPTNGATISSEVSSTTGGIVDASEPSVIRSSNADSVNLNSSAAVVVPGSITVTSSSAPSYMGKCVAQASALLLRLTRSGSTSRAGGAWFSAEPIDLSTLAINTTGLQSISVKVDTLAKSSFSSGQTSAQAVINIPDILASQPQLGGDAKYYAAKITASWLRDVIPADDLANGIIICIGGNGSPATDNAAVAPLSPGGVAGVVIGVLIAIALIAIGGMVVIKRFYSKNGSGGNQGQRLRIRSSQSNNNNNLSKPKPGVTPLARVSIVGSDGTIAGSSTFQFSNPMAAANQAAAANAAAANNVPPHLRSPRSSAPASPRTGNSPSPHSADGSSPTLRSATSWRKKNQVVPADPRATLIAPGFTVVRLPSDLHAIVEGNAGAAGGDGQLDPMATSREIRLQSQPSWRARETSTTSGPQVIRRGDSLNSPNGGGGGAASPAAGVGGYGNFGSAVRV